MTIQAQTFAPASALDEIEVLMGALPSEELAARQKIRTARNAANFNLAQTESDQARALYWLVIEVATAMLFRPEPQLVLDKAVEYLRGLLISARRVTDLEALI